MNTGINEFVAEKVHKGLSYTMRWKEYCFSSQEIAFLEGIRKSIYNAIKSLSEVDISDQELLDIESVLRKSLPIDGNSDGHQIEQFFLTREYGKYDFPDGHENHRNLGALSLIHDTGELGVGDKTLYAQGTSEERMEYERREKDAGILLLSMQITNRRKLQKLLKIYDINFNRNHKLYKFFRAYEILSYLNGAEIAYKNRDKMRNESDLISEVLIAQMPNVKELLGDDDIKSLKVYLGEKQLVIDELFKYTLDDYEFSEDSHGTLSKKTRLLKAQKIWDSIKCSTLK